MYRVMIIDDEPIIVRGLSGVIDWKKFDCEVVATAGSGQEGLERIKQYRPDIIFSDIAMPGLSGLEMIAGMKADHPDTEICILTGYRDFDFAQQAIKLGVTRFLLKPSDMTELNEAVKTMKENLDRKNQPAPEEKEAVVGTEEADREANSVSANSFVVKNAIQYLEEHYAEKITLSDLAEKVYVSQWHLSKLLNKHMNQSFSEILNTIRMNKAKELLEIPSLRIGDVAEEVGFLDVAHFSKVFKKMEGISANEYRNTILGR